MIKTVRAGFALVFLGGLLAGCGTSPLTEGNEAFHEGEFAIAEARWKPLAEDGNFHAQHNLGILHKTLGDSASAAFWWEQAVAQDFVPSMLELGALKLASGEPDEAEALYSRAARWGSADAFAALEALEKPVPHADLFFAQMHRFEIQQTRMASSLDREDSNEYMNRILDYYAAKAEDD